MVVGKKRIGEKAFQVINIFILLLFSVIILYPFMNIISISLSEVGSVMRGEVSFYPIGINFKAYIKIIQNSSILQAYLNTLIVVVGGTFFGVFLTAFAAYPLSKKIPGAVFISFIIAITLWFDPGIIPRFLVVRNLQLYDKLYVLILVNLLSAYNIFVVRSFFSSIPVSLEESALIEGCRESGVLFRIVLPLSKPVLATIALWIAVLHWNSFLDPLMYLRSRTNFTLQLILRDIVIANNIQDYGMVDDITAYSIANNSISYAAIISSILPVMALYPFLQKYFVKGVMIGAVKS